MKHEMYKFEHPECKIQHKTRYSLMLFWVKKEEAAITVSLNTIRPHHSFYTKIETIQAPRLHSTICFPWTSPAFVCSFVLWRRNNFSYPGGNWLCCRNCTKTHQSIAKDTLSAQIYGCTERTREYMKKNPDILILVSGYSLLTVPA